MSDFTKLGDYELSKLEITSHNGFKQSVVTLASSIQIYEDLFSSSITARITILDDVGLMNYLPVIGQEKVEIQFKTRGGDTQISLNMVIHKISSVSNENLAQSYNLELVTEDMISNFETRISEHFEGSATEIAQKCFERINSSKTFDVEPSDDRYDQETGIIIPNMTPMRAINFLCDRAYSESYKSSSYVFFETTKGYKLKSIESMAQGEKRNEFFLGDLKNTGSGAPDAFLDPNSENKKVITYSFNSNFSVLDNIAKGMYVGNLTTVDMVTRNTKTFTHSYWDNSTDYQYMNDGPIQDVSGQGRQYRPESYYLLPEVELTAGKPLYNQEKIFLSRLFYKQLMENIKCTITVYGDSDLVTGDCLELNVPLFSSTDPDKKDEYYSGKYIIFALRHRIQGGRYIMDLELVKDSFNETLPSPVPQLVGPVGFGVGGR